MTDRISLSRRQTLQALSGAIVVTGTAGCLDGQGVVDGDGEGTESQATTTAATPGPFTDISIETRTLQVGVRSDSAVSRVNVIGPNGELYGSQQRSQGVTQLRFTLEYDYTPGVYQIVAVDTSEDERLGKTSLEIAPELSMPTVEIASERDGGLPDHINWPEVAFHCRIRNNGNGPAYLDRWSTSGNQPGSGVENGRFQLADSDYWIETVDRDKLAMVSSETEISIFTSSGVMVPASDKIEEECSQNPKTATFTFSVHTTSGDTVSQQFEYTYEMNDSGQCSVDNLSPVDGG